MSDDPLFRDEAYLEQLGDAELYFEDTGPEGAPAILYLHGGPGYNAHSFRDLAGEELESYRVVYLDQRGSGRSSELEADAALYTVDALVDDVERVREFLGLERFTPLGHGFGAVIALEYARRFADRVSGVIVVNPWVHFPELSHALLSAAARLAEKPLPDEVPEDSEARVALAFSLLNARDLLNTLHFRDARSRMRLEFSDSEANLLAGGLVQEGLIANGLWDFEYPPFLGDLSVPVTVIAGVHDVTSYPGQVDWVVDLAGAGGELIEMDAGHYPWLDDPEAFAAAVRSAVPSPEVN